MHAQYRLLTNLSQSSLNPWIMNNIVSTCGCIYIIYIGTYAGNCNITKETENLHFH